MLRSIGAVVAGYVVMVVATMLLFVVLMVVDPAQFGPEAAGAGGVPGTGWILLILIWGLVSAGAGGYATARIAARSPLGHVLALVGLAGAMGLVNLVANLERAPVWYLAGLLVVSVAGILLGGRLAPTGAAEAPATGPAPDPVADR